MMFLKCKICGTTNLRILKMYTNDSIIIREVQCENGHITEIIEHPKE